MKNQIIFDVKKDALEFPRTFPASFKSSQRTIVLFVFLLGLLAWVLHPLDVPFDRAMAKSQTEP